MWSEFISLTCGLRSMWENESYTLVMIVLMNAVFGYNSIQLCLFQVASVCDLVTYLRYITLGLVKSQGTVKIFSFK